MASILLTVFNELRSRKTVRILEHTVSAVKYQPQKLSADIAASWRALFTK